MRMITISVFLICSFSVCGAQDASSIASVKIEQPTKPAHVGDAVRLTVTVTNHSKEEIIIEESRAGAWQSEVYDPLDPTGKDLAMPLKQKYAYHGDLETMIARSSIPAGGSLTMSVLLSVDPEVYSHPGSYKVILDKREWKNHVLLRSNPVNIVIVPK